MKIRKRVTYANLVSTLALFLALGTATTFAADQLSSKSVGARQLRPGAVTARKIRKNAVTSPKLMALAVKQAKVADGAIGTAKLAAGAVSGAKLAAGSVGTDKIAADAVTGAQLDEATLGPVPKAQRAESATTAESANPVAFASVDQEGGVDTSLSKGIGPGDVRSGVEGGVYCISVPGFSPKGAQVTPRYNGSGQIRAFVTIGGAPECAAPGVEVRMWNNVSLTKAPFYISLYR